MRREFALALITLVLYKYKTYKFISTIRIAAQLQQHHRKVTTGTERFDTRIAASLYAMSSVIESMPADVLHYIIENFILGFATEAGIDSAPFPATLLALPLVSRWFYNIITSRTDSLVMKAICNFRNKTVAPVPTILTASKEFGSISFVRWLSETLRFPLHNYQIYHALAGGHLALVDWFRSRGSSFAGFCKPRDFTFVRKRDLHQITEVIHLVVKELAFNETCVWLELIEAALERGDVYLADWLMSAARLRWEEGTLFVQNAIRSGKPSVLQAVLDRGAPLTVDNLIEQTTLDMVRLLHEKHGVALSKELAREAARAGNVDLLRYLKEKGVRMKYQLPILAVCYCRPAALLWCTENGLALTPTDINSENISDAVLHARGREPDLEQLLHLLCLSDKARTVAALRAEEIADVDPSTGTWRFLLALGMRSSISALATVAESQRCDTLETVKLLIEALPAWPGTHITLSVMEMRRDVRTYLRKYDPRKIQFRLLG